jgi:hypothetical protein
MELVALSEMGRLATLATAYKDVGYAKRTGNVANL